jgi:hypothetical protein
MGENESRSEVTNHAAGTGPETKKGDPEPTDRPDADPRDPESAGNEDLRTPGSASD